MENNEKFNCICSIIALAHKYNNLNEESLINNLEELYGAPNNKVVPEDFCAKVREISPNVALQVVACRGFPPNNETAQTVYCACF